MHVHNRLSFGIGVNFWLPIPWIPSPLQRIRAIVIPGIRYVGRVQWNFCPFIDFASFLNVVPVAADFDFVVAVLIQEYHDLFTFTFTCYCEVYTLLVMYAL